MGRTNAELVTVTFSPTTVDIGMPLRIDAVVRNTGSNTLYTQGPAPGHVYLEGQDFDSAGFPKLDGMYRVGNRLRRQLQHRQPVPLGLAWSTGAW